MKRIFEFFKVLFDGWRIWIDTETTGLDHRHCDIIEVSLCVKNRRRGVFLVETWKVRPKDFLKKMENPCYSAVFSEAENIHKITRGEVEGFSLIGDVVIGMNIFLKGVIPKGEKAFIAGYNVKFDYAFLEKMEQDCGLFNSSVSSFQYFFDGWCIDPRAWIFRKPKNLRAVFERYYLPGGADLEYCKKINDGLFHSANFDVLAAIRLTAKNPFMLIPIRLKQYKYRGSRSKEL